MRKTLLFWALSLSISVNCQIVKTDKGRVEGYTKNGIQIFKSIPFAAPPIDNLRWKAPQESKKWSGTLVCKEFSASPMQRKPEPFLCWTEEFIAPPSPLSEDCLYLNIWTKNSKKKKPVLVWIYGGGLSSGSAACAIYDGKNYAKNDVVFVGINYRVNIFGFFAHPELTKESGGIGACNFGLLDQLEALKWVKRNIAAFGGDPNNVTIMGQSAGSFSVHALVASTLAKGLFHKAIGHSGGILGNNRGVLLKEAESNGEKIFSQMKLNSFADLRALPAEELLNKVSKFNPIYSPVLDGYFLPTKLKEHYSAKKHNDVPTLTGWVTGDGAMGGNGNISREKYFENIKIQFKDKAEEYLKYFPGNTQDEIKSSTSKQTKFGFAAIPAVLWATYNSSPSYIYEFDHVPVEKPNFPDYGAFHTAEVPFALGTLDTWNRPWRALDLQMEKTMTSFWLNFIKTGNPNGDGLNIWPKYESKTKAIMQLNPQPKAINEMYAKELELLIN